MLSLKGTIVTTDALNSQRAIAQQIIDQDGDYVLARRCRSAGQASTIPRNLELMRQVGAQFLETLGMARDRWCGICDARLTWSAASGCGG